MLKKTVLSLTIASSAMALVACNDTETVAEPVDEPVVETEPMVEADPIDETMADTEPMTDMTATQTIAEIAAGNEDFTILTAAIQSAGLDSMMSEAGSYTVFAPTDAAFTQVLDKLGVTKDDLLANTELLNSVLPYHVLPNIVLAEEIPYGTDIETVNGATIMIDEGNVITDGAGNTATITDADIMATNGVVHTIDTVLMPE